MYLVSPAVSRIPGKVLMVYVPGFSGGKPHSGKGPDGLCIPGFSSDKAAFRESTDGLCIPGFSSGKPHSGKSPDGLCIPGFSSGKPHSGKSPDGLVCEVQGIPRGDVNHFWYDLIVNYGTNYF
jgi:hypothetical protein